MKLFIDSANIEEIRAAWDLGVIAGVTTNPSLVATQRGDFHGMIHEICQIVEGPVSAEPFSTDLDGMLEEAEKLSAIHPNVVIKIPLCENGLRAIRILSQRGIPTNATLVFSANQALLAARAGARYVSTFLGRLDDAGNNGLTVLEEIMAVLDQYAMMTEVIAASVRNPMHVTGAALRGSHIATIPFNVLKMMIKHPLTDLGIAKFEADARNYLKKE